MSQKEHTWTGFCLDLILVMAPMLVGGYFMNKYLKNLNGPKDGVDSSRTVEALRKSYLQWRKNGNKGEFPCFDEYELCILSEIVFPDSVSTTLDDIGGLEDIKASLIETVVLPLRSPMLYSMLGATHTPEQTPHGLYSSLPAGGHDMLAAPLGVLFYGPPGTGKTLTARALAKESGAVFISASPSMLQSKWHGESEKLIRALFSVARKLAPAIIFVDEMDVFLAQRGSGAHEVTSRLTGEFLAQWDGLCSATADSRGSVVVVGATNRSFSLDEAVLRRMPRQILFDLPALPERRAIARVLLAGLAVDPDCIWPDDSGAEGEQVDATATRTAMDGDMAVLRGREALAEVLARESQGYSGADMKEATRFAAMIPLKEFVRACRQKQHQAGAHAAADNMVTTTHTSATLAAVSGAATAANRPRLMCVADVRAGLREVRPTGWVAARYAERTSNLQRGRAAPGHALGLGMDAAATAEVEAGGIDGDGAGVDAEELAAALRVLMRAQTEGVRPRKPPATDNPPQGP